MIRRGTPNDAQSFEDAWACGDSSRVSVEVADLVHTAELLCRSAVAEPAEAFRADLRSRLMTEAADVLVANPVPALAEPVVSATPATRKNPMRKNLLRRRLAGLTAAAVAGIGSVGMISVSATAVPGDALYRVKRGVESVQMTFHRGDTSRGEFQLGQARERLAEAWWLDAHGKDNRVADALDTFSTQATEGSSRLFTAYGDQSSATTIATVNDFATAATVTLTAMSDDLPADAQTSLAAAAATVTGLVSQASSLCGSCIPADVSSLVAAGNDAAPADSPSDSGSPDSTPEKAAAGNDGTGSPAPSGVGQPAAPPTKAPSLQAPSLQAPSLQDITDPLIGGLLGDGR